MTTSRLSILEKQNFDDDYVQSWYPVAASNEIKRGKQRAVTLFGTEWVLFRTKSGQVSFLKRHCCHMGADLCQGKIIGETIECPLHAWQFDISGKCIHIPNFSPTGDKELPNRSVISLECKEQYGIVFVFLGNESLFPIPSPPEMPYENTTSDVLTHTFDSNYKVFSLNSFDTQHFKHVHNREFVGKPSIYKSDKYALRIDFKAKIYQRKRWVDYILSLKEKVFSLSIECWGVNVLSVKNHDFDSFAVIGLQPIHKNKTRIYLVSFKESKSKLRIFDKLAVYISARLFRNFLMADLQATKNIRLHQSGLVDELDEGSRLYWDFFASLPHIEAQKKGRK